MKLNNQNIIYFYEQLNDSFNDNNKYFPAKITFIIQKNKNILKNLTNEIYQMRDNIIIHYGVADADNSEIYNISENLQKTAQQELDDLLNVQQNVQILTFKLKDIEDLEFTSNQMEAIMFMIEEENEDQVE